MFGGCTQICCEEGNNLLPAKPQEWNKIIIEMKYIDNTNVLHLVYNTCFTFGFIIHVLHFVKYKTCIDNTNEVIIP